MHRTLKTLCALMIPIALSLGGTDASAKKKKKKKEPVETVDSAPAAKSDPVPPAAAAPAAPPAAPEQTPAAAPSPAAEQPASSAAVPPAAVTPVPVAATTPPPDSPPARRDGVRFRGGIAASGGAEFLPAFGLTGALGAVDGRLGVQIRNLVGVYVQPHVAFGSWIGVGGPFGGLTGNFAATAVVDFTFINRIFVGAGVGGGVVNNPGGAVVHLRVGGYPVIKLAPDRPRRKALMVGMDLRTYFINAGTGTVPNINLMFGVGYEAF